MLFFGRQLGHVFVRVAMKADLVASISDFGELFRKAFDAVRWREESGLDVVLIVELEETVDTSVAP